MPLLLGSLLSFLGSVGARFLTDSLLRYVAYKALAVTLFITILPILLKNFMVWLFEQVSSVAAGSMNSESIGSAVVHFSDIGGYLASNLLLPDCISLLLTAVIIRFTLNLIPFVG